MSEGSGRERGGGARDRLVQAVVVLLDEREPDRVTITDIVAKAGVSRPTFYALLGDLPTAFAEAAMVRVRAAFEGAIAVDVADGDRAQVMLEVIVQILDRLEIHAEFFGRVTSGHGGHLVQEAVVGFLSEELLTNTPVSAALRRGCLRPEFAGTALAAATTWMTLAWLTTEPREPSRVVGAQLRDLMLHSVVGGIGASITSEQAGEV